MGLALKPDTDTVNGRLCCQEHRLCRRGIEGMVTNPVCSFRDKIVRCLFPGLVVHEDHSADFWVLSAILLVCPKMSLKLYYGTIL